MATKENALRASAHGENSESRRGMIIQCPKCKTKFSVSADLIAGFDLPRFHCSRCDHVFDLDPKSETTAIESSDAPAAAPQLHPPTVQPPILESIENADPSDTGEFPVQPAPYLPQPPTARFDDDEDEDDSYTSFAKPSFMEPRSLQIPKNFDAKLTPEAPHEARDSHSESKADPSEQIAFSFPSSEMPPHLEEKESDTGEFAVSFGKPEKSDFTLVSPNFSVKSQVSHQPSLASPEDFAPSSVTTEFPGVGISIPDPMPTRVGPWRSFFMIAAPMMAIVLALSGLSFYLVRSPEFAHAFIHSISSSAPKFPPAALNLANLRFKKVTLDGGQTIHTISGALRNNSKEIFSEIILEGLAFGSDGKVLAQTKVNAGSTLADTRLKSLPPEMLRDLQNTAPAKKYDLAPGKEQEFTIALIDPISKTANINKAVYFSARVLSVRN